jgi:glycosyltransferase involved in cell wall biosynthesis
VKVENRSKTIGGGTNLQRVDVVVPCYNYAHYLTECVESVLGQADVDVRVLILDDASPDNTPDVGSALASRDQRVTYRRHESNRGHIATYNEGIEWATGDLFLLLSADDYLLPGALGPTSRLMQANANVGFTFANALIAEPDGRRHRVDPISDRDVPHSGVLRGAAFIRLSGATNIVPTPTAVVRTELQKRVGGYRQELPHSGDMEMWLRLAGLGDVGFINEVHAVYRRHAANMSLQYVDASVLPDLRQRQAALEMLFSDGPELLRRDRRLQDYLMNDLGQQALQQAGAAFNRFDTASAQHLQRFALEVSPRIRGTSSWVKLAIKQFMGPGRWQVLNAISGRSAREASR